MQGQHTPEHVAIVGAGMAGLATAWFLQQRGVGVTVVDRRAVAAGSSWGNAGLINPAFTTPQPEPSVLRFGLASLFRSAGPLAIPRRVDPALWRFLLGFARNCTRTRWQRSMAVFNELNRACFGAYEQLGDGGVAAPLRTADPFLVACTSHEERDELVEQLDITRAQGAEIEYDLIDGARARALEPSLSALIHSGIQVHGQRFLNPPEYMRALARSLLELGGEIRESTEITAIRDLGPRGVALQAAGGHQLRADAAVLACGSWLSPYARRFGVRSIVRAGRGYSFSVHPDPMPTRPIYFPGRHVACNPLGDRFRVTGMMEFSPPDAAFEPDRIRTIIESTRPLFSGVDWDRRDDEWVGSRPCTADGLPLVGATTSPRVHISGGHGMWGMVFGPVTGRALADTITGRPAPAWMNQLDPLR